MQDVSRTAFCRLSDTFLSTYPRCLEMLQQAVLEWLDHPADDYCRTRAHDLARSLLQGCKVCGYREDSGILEPVAVLLVRPFRETTLSLADLRERFGGLFKFLKSPASVRSA